MIHGMDGTRDSRGEAPALIAGGAASEDARLRQSRRSLETLMAAVKDLSLARRQEDIIEIVRHAARRLNGADGATFILRDADQCFYADEDAIEPLWKGKRFPLTACISGWSMLNREAAVIEDIYRDARIPHQAYRPTFVQSLVMVPIRKEAPIGAIGNYWARRRMPSQEEVELIQHLADATSLAFENVQVYAELENRVRDRTARLEAMNRELEAFSQTVSHDLRGPLGVITLYGDLLADKTDDRLTADDRGAIGAMQASARRMEELIVDLLRLSKVSHGELEPERIDLGALAREILAGLAAASPGRKHRFVIEDGLEAWGDYGFLKTALENLLSNAWKYSGKRPEAVIELGRVTDGEGRIAFRVRDNGVGFPAEEAGRLFEPFQRLSSAQEFPGTGIGLATVARILERHGGRIWAESRPGAGSDFFFRLPQPT